MHRLVRWPSFVVLMALVALVALPAACGDSRPSGEGASGGTGLPLPDPVPISAEMQGALDRGNAAFRDDDLEGAWAAYVEAVAMDSTVAAPWFGLLMVHDARGEEAQAAEVRRRLDRLEAAADTGGVP